MKEYNNNISECKSSKFNLPASLVEAIPEIGDHDTAVLMHNDGVAEGLCEAPFMQDVERGGVLTIGTGLGNARFTNRRKEKDKGKDEKKDNKNKVDRWAGGEPLPVRVSPGSRGL